MTLIIKERVGIKERKKRKKEKKIRVMNEKVPKT